ncbi:hypothetical protein J3Q64DRAFT_1697230 [Phycomyces blakesleeanus]|uniref:Uncharacterized protein n=1 Tax=Phycomyces blakesleeanus TaxID=4837 RepID=A0ABR3B3W6_PHYBL
MTHLSNSLLKNLCPFVCPSDSQFIRSFVGSYNRTLVHSMFVFFLFFLLKAGHVNLVCFVPIYGLAVIELQIMSSYLCNCELVVFLKSRLADSCCVVEKASCFKCAKCILSAFFKLKQ